VARLTEEAGVVAVPAQSPFQTLGDLLAALRADPAAVPVAGGSAGGIDHITLGLILRALGAQPRAAAYVAFAGGGPALAAILGGQVKAAISGLSEFSEQIRAGRMRALATTGAARTDPAVPTLRELGVNVVATNWRGVFAAPGVRAEARERLVALVTAVAQRPEWAALLRQRDWQDAFLAGPGFAEFLARDQAQTAAVLRDIGLAG
jgi:putative tricarboxylic transport membrane protein